MMMQNTVSSSPPSKWTYVCAARERAIYRDRTEKWEREREERESEQLQCTHAHMQTMKYECPHTSLGMCLAWEEYLGPVVDLANEYFALDLFERWAKQREKLNEKTINHCSAGRTKRTRERETLSLTATDRNYWPVMMCLSVMPAAVIGSKLRKQSYLLLLVLFRSMSIPEGIDRFSFFAPSRKTQCGTD